MRDLSLSVLQITLEVVEVLRQIESDQCDSGEDSEPDYFDCFFKAFGLVQPHVKKDMQHWIIQHLQVVRSTIANYIVKLYFDGHTEKSISKLLL